MSLCNKSASYKIIVIVEQNYKPLHLESLLYSIFLRSAVADRKVKTTKKIRIVS